MARPAAITRDMPYEPGHVTLLLVDMQRIWVEPDLDPAYPNATPDDYLYRELRHSNCLRDFSTAARNATLFSVAPNSTGQQKKACKRSEHSDSVRFSLTPTGSIRSPRPSRHRITIETTPASTEAGTI